MDPKEFVNHYKVLGVSVTATPAEIRQAYLRQSLATHPDKNRGTPETTAAFRQVNTAYETLHDEAKRAPFDAQPNPEQRDEDVNFTQQEEDTPSESSWRSPWASENLGALHQNALAKAKCLDDLMQANCGRLLSFQRNLDAVPGVFCDEALADAICAWGKAVERVYKLAKHVHHRLKTMTKADWDMAEAISTAAEMRMMDRSALHWEVLLGCLETYAAAHCSTVRSPGRNSLSLGQNKILKEIRAVVGRWGEYR